MSDALPALLQLSDVGEARYRVHQPSESAEGRDVVFSGQLLGQMIMASDRFAGGQKDVKSVHAIFARAGTYTQPIELELDSMQAGRTWASDTVTAVQGGKLLSRALVLLSIVDPDLMRHEPEMPKVAGPDAVAPAPGQAFPGAEVRPLPADALDGGPVPVSAFWHRFERPVDSQAANQAILSWATCGNIIGLAMQPHRDKVRIEDAHRTISTGVMSHTIRFHDRFDVSQWLLVVNQATKASGGRVNGGGQVFTEDGVLVATFEQDSMARTVEGTLDPKRAM